VVTFDDGFRNNYHEALPVLEKYSIPATVFITAELIGTSELIWSDLLIYAFSETPANKLTHDEVGSYSLKTVDETSTSLRSIVGILKTVPAEQKDRIVNDIVQTLLPDGVDSSSPLYESLKLMSWSELTELSRSECIQIGGHTCSHNILTRLSREAAQAEIEGCKSVLEDKLKNRVDVFAYPNGTRNDFSAQDVDLLRSGGWQSAVTTEENRVTVPFDRYRIPRLGIGAGTSLGDFSYMLSGRSHRNTSSLATLPLRIVKAVVAGRY
jgi:peptidoglycan/xylan/chitin deacetylase (PgdA/CDA1 family)